ncbi:hypothetical protein POTOM_054788 [Populus tomentosa]|uniref:Histone deacetylase interacting domain-containing protein n=1 Tax=Populus tomentosa TaxID=118781 RepID=A0A8X7XZW4_POPTO|nr:hypothetical protein POTOM_054788 [Populus tomentosa]
MCLDFYRESEIYLKELGLRFQDQPENLRSFYRVMEDIRDLRDEFSGRLKKVPDHVLARLKAILEGHCDLIRGFNVFLPPSHCFSVDDDDEDDDSEAAEVGGQEDKMEAAAALAEKPKLLPGFEDDADLLECFYRVMRACEAPSSVASQSPDSRVKDVKNSGAVLIKAGEERKKQHPEKIEVAQGNDKERNFVRGFAVKPGDHVMFFYYINGRIGKYEWKESIVAMIRKHPDLMDEFQRYVSVFENVQVSRSEVEEEDEVQRIETRGSQDRKREKYPNKSILDLSRCKKCTPSYRYLPKGYRVPSKHNAMQPELKVLNNRILLVPSGSKYFSTRKSNENEKIMLECDDNRYEMDMLISWFSSAVEYAEELEKGIDDNEMEKGNRKIFLWCLERLYGDKR